MNAATPLERIAASHAALAPGLAGGPAWDERRQRALASLLDCGLPDRRDENWKYLDHARVAEYLSAPAANVGVTALQLTGLELPVAGARRVVLVDGRFDALLSDMDAGDGVEVEGLDALLARDPPAALAALRAPGAGADDRYALLAEAFAADGVLIRVAAGAAPARPIYLMHVCTAAAPATHQSRVVIDAAAGASLVLVEHFVALGAAAALGNLAAELRLGADARMTHLRLHQHGGFAAQVETWAARLGPGSRYDQHLLVLGGRLVRSSLDLTLAGPRADCRLTGLFMADGERQVDLYTRISHEGAATRTVQDFRGIASDRGRGAFNGRIVVHPSARGADASQQSRNLLLSPLAEINSRPQLEIHVDDVQCRHGATIGTLDPAQLFYLLSRGLDPDTARALLTFAFCQDVTGRLPLPELRTTVEAMIAGTLPDRELIRGLA